MFPKSRRGRGEGSSGCPCCCLDFIVWVIVKLTNESTNRRAAPLGTVDPAPAAYERNKLFSEPASQLTHDDVGWTTTRIRASENGHLPRFLDTGGSHEEGACGRTESCSASIKGQCDRMSLLDYVIRAAQLWNNKKEETDFCSPWSSWTTGSRRRKEGGGGPAEM